jgi:HTH-type transcriptional regulator/antitoxin HigA
MTNIYNSDLAIHSGEFLEETLEATGMTQSELSNRLGRPLQTINEIIKGKKSITSTTALELEDVLGVPSHIWLGLENQYQIVLAKQKELKLMQEETKLLSNFPYADLAKSGFVKTTRKAIEKVDELKRFFEVAKLVQIPQVKVYQPAFRVSSQGNISHEAIASWLQAGRIKAKDIETKAFDKKKLKEKLIEIKSLMTLEDINEAIKEIQKVLNSCGIALVLLPHFKKTKVHGATFWLDNEKAVIAMTLRGSFSDVFWFSFFHEVGHILLHPKREIFLEDGYSDPKLQKQEYEANTFAKDLLINNYDFNKFISSNISKTSVIEFAKQQGIKSSIVVGRLMYEKIIKFNDYKLSPLRDRYKWI